MCRIVPDEREGHRPEGRTGEPRRPGTKPLAPRRDIKVQVCFSADERARLEREARAAGYETVAAYVRARTVAAPDGAA